MRVSGLKNIGLNEAMEWCDNKLNGESKKNELS